MRSLVLILLLVLTGTLLLVPGGGPRPQASGAPSVDAGPVQSDAAMTATGPGSLETRVADLDPARAAGGRRTVSDLRRVRVGFRGAAPAPVELHRVTAGGGTVQLEDTGEGFWELPRERSILAVRAPGFAGELAALAEADGDVSLQLEALGEISMRAVGQAGAPIEGVLAFLALAFEHNERSSAERGLRLEESRSLFSGTLEPELFEAVFERLRRLPFDSIDRVLLTLGERDLSGMTDARGVITWPGIPAQEGIAVELDTDCRCEDADGNPALSKVGELTREEFLVREIEQRRSARFDLAPGAAVRRTFRCEPAAVVRGRIAALAAGERGTVTLRDVRTDLTVEGSSVLSLNEKGVDCDALGRFALVVKPGRKRLLARWEEDGCLFTAEREFHLAPGADLDLGMLEPAADQRAVTLRPVLTDAVGNLLEWSEHAAGLPPTVILSYRVLVDDAGLADAPLRGATEVVEARCRIGESVRLCGLPSGELHLTTLLEWGAGATAPQGLVLRRGAGKLQRIGLRDDAPGEALVPFVTEVPYGTSVVVHADGDAAPLEGEVVAGTLLRFGGDARMTASGRRDADGALHFDFHAAAGQYVFYAQVPGASAHSDFGIFALEPVLVGEAPRVETAWSHGVQVELVDREGSWDPSTDMVELLLRTPVGEVALQVVEPASLDGIPPGSGIDLVNRERGYFIAPGNPTVRIAL